MSIQKKKKLHFFSYRKNGEKYPCTKNVENMEKYVKKKEKKNYK